MRTTLIVTAVAAAALVGLWWLTRGRGVEEREGKPMGDKIVKTKYACSLGESWFKHHTAERLYPDALIDGKPAPVEDAVEAAADFLLRANMPLVYGLSNITCEAQREAVSLAELTGGVIDSHTSL